MIKDDIGDILGFIGVTFFLLLFGFVVIYSTVMVAYLDPIREDKAQKMCVDSGFDTFIRWQSKMFTTEVLALYCGTYEQRMIREGRIDAYQNTGDEKGTFVIKSSSGS